MVSSCTWWFVLAREDTSLSFEEYLGQGVDLDSGVILDAGMGFGITTLEIAERISLKKSKARIISVDIAPPPKPLNWRENVCDPMDSWN